MVLEGYEKVEKASPSVLVVDSFRTVVRKALGGTTKWSCNPSSSVSPALDELASHDFFGREYVEGEIVTIRFHGRRWPLLALPGCGAKFYCAKATDRELAGQASSRNDTFALHHAGCKPFHVLLGWPDKQEDTQ